MTRGDKTRRGDDHVTMYYDILKCSVGRDGHVGGVPTIASSCWRSCTWSSSGGGHVGVISSATWACAN